MGLFLQQFQLPGARHSLGAIANIQLYKYVRSVSFDCPHSNDQLIGDLFVIATLGDQTQDVQLAPAERLNETLDLGDSRSRGWRKCGK